MAAPTRDDMPRSDEGRKGATGGRKESVNDRRGTRDLGLASVWSSTRRAPRMLPRLRPDSHRNTQRIGDEMGVLIYIVLTVLIFGLLGLVQKLVEGL
jgi:hypothetical protein